MWKEFSTNVPATKNGSLELGPDPPLLLGTQRDRGTGPEPEPEAWMEGFGERGVEGFKVDQRVGADDVERQESGGPVHVHGYSVGVGGGGGRDGCCCAVVADGITTSVAVESPGMVVLSKLAVSIVAFPPDTWVTDGDEDPPFTLHLPVTAPSQAVAAQHLWPPLESVWVIGVRLFLLHEPHRPGAVEQLQL